MKPRIKLAFCDFWPQFNPLNNYFTRLLRQQYEVEISEQPDFLIYSCFGRNHRRFRCIRILYAGENWRANYRSCDWAFTFDHSDHPRHYRLPLYALYEDPRELIKPPFDAERVLAEKTRFCNFVYSNPLCRMRNRFFHLLSKYKPVDSGGRLYNNLGGPVADKMLLLRQSKFTIAFENESQAGYTTEKLSQPMRAFSLPIYWGNPLVNLDFNPHSFINVHDWPSLEAAVQQVVEADRDNAKYLAYLRQPWYHQNRVNPFADPENILAQFDRIFHSSTRPVALAGSAPAAVFFDRLLSLPQSLRKRMNRSGRKIAYRLRSN